MNRKSHDSTPSSSDAGPSGSSANASSATRGPCAKCGKQDPPVDILCKHCNRLYHGKCNKTYIFENNPGLLQVLLRPVFYWRCDECYEKDFDPFIAFGTLDRLRLEERARFSRMMEKNEECPPFFLGKKGSKK